MPRRDPTSDPVRIQQAALVAAVLGCYGVACFAPFVWDDEVFVLANPALDGWGQALALFTTPWFDGALYRPFQLLVHALEYRLFGPRPAAFHAINVVLHATNALLVLHLLRRLELPPPEAFLVALLFAVHPVGTAAVTYVSGLGDVLFLLLGLGCMHAFLDRERGSRTALARALVYLVLALLTKESAVTIAPILMWYVALLPGEQRRRALPACGLLLGIAALYTSLRLVAAGGLATNTLSPIAEASLAERLLTLPRILATDVRLLVAPYDLRMEYHFVQGWPIGPEVALGVLAAAILLAVAIAAAPDRRRSLFFAGWFGIGLLPVLHLPVALSATLREHWLYLPSIGFLALLLPAARRAWIALAREHPGRRAGVALAGGVALLLAGTTVSRNLDWLDPLVLYEHDLALEPRSFVLRNNLGVEHLRRGDAERAKRAFLSAIAASPGGRYCVAHSNLGVVLEREGNTRGARRSYRRALALCGYPRARENLRRLDSR